MMCRDVIIKIELYIYLVTNISDHNGIKREICAVLQHQICEIYMTTFELTSFFAFPLF